MTVKTLPSNVLDSQDRIIKKISSENTQLREQLSQVLSRVKENEAIWSHFNEIENIVMSSDNIVDMASRIVTELKTRFKLDVVTIILTSDDEGGPANGESPEQLNPAVENVYIVNEDAIRKHIRSVDCPILLNNWGIGSKTFFFPGESSVGSAALIPLEIWGMLVGTLNLGSKDTGRYHPRNDTSLLHRLAAKLSIGINNAIVKARLQKLTVTDELTGLFNRRHLVTIAESEFERAVRYGTICSYIMIDLDGFKAINDKFGHEAGDQALIAFATLLKRRLRAVDTCARIGGDEFCVILPETNLAGALSTAEKLLSELHNLKIFSDQGNPLRLKASMGIASSEGNTTKSWEEILRDADRNMYTAKSRGGGVFKPLDGEKNKV